MGNESDFDSPQRLTTKRKTVLVLSIFIGDISTQEAARQNGLTVAEIQEWKDCFLSGAESALQSRSKDEEALKDEQIKKLERKVCQLVKNLGDTLLLISIITDSLKMKPLAAVSSEALK